MADDKESAFFELCTKRFGKWEEELTLCEQGQGKLPLPRAPNERLVSRLHATVATYPDVFGVVVDRHQALLQRQEALKAAEQARTRESANREETSAANSEAKAAGARTGGAAFGGDNGVTAATPPVSSVPRGGDMEANAVPPPVSNASPTPSSRPASTVKSGAFRAMMAKLRPDIVAETEVPLAPTKEPGNQGWLDENLGSGKGTREPKQTAADPAPAPEHKAAQNPKGAHSSPPSAPGKVGNGQSCAQKLKSQPPPQPLRTEPVLSKLEQQPTLQSKLALCTHVRDYSCE